MSGLSDQHNMRQFYLKHDRLPSINTMQEAVPAPLRSLIMQSVTPKQKALLNSESTVKGALKGHAWFVPPKDLLYGRTVKKPLKNEHLAKLNHEGIYKLGAKLAIAHRNGQQNDLDKFKDSVDDQWLIRFHELQKKQWAIYVAKHKRKNSEHIKKIFNLFSQMYTESLKKIEHLLRETLEKRVMILEDELIKPGQEKYETLLKKQAIHITTSYDKKLTEEKYKLKSEFIEKLNVNRTELTNAIHDVTVEKRAVLNKLRKYYECQNLACQIYVALKERQRFQEEKNNYVQKFNKEVKPLDEKIKKTDKKIRVLEEQLSKQDELKSQWQKKVCHVLKNFQMFVSFCLRVFPEYAKFFINLEKLMLLQLSESLEDPTYESIIVEDTEQVHNTPKRRPGPFYIFRDKANQSYPTEQNSLKHNISLSHLPIIVVNKRCMYAACDKFDQLGTEISQFINDKLKDSKFQEDGSEHWIPVKHTTSLELSELNMESSLLQILKQEMYSLKETPIYCDYCQLLHCFCTCEADEVTSVTSRALSEAVKSPKQPPVSFEAGKSTDIQYFKVPADNKQAQFNSYLDFVKTRRCSCAKTAKKSLEENLPDYMKRMSKFEPAELPNYEPCPVATLKKLVKEARGRISLPLPTKSPSTNVDVGTQCEREIFERICICDPADLTVQRPCRKQSYMLNNAHELDECKLVTGSFSSTILDGRASSFAMDRAYSLRKLIAQSSELEEIFKKKDC